MLLDYDCNDSVMTKDSIVEVLLISRLLHSFHLFSHNAPGVLEREIIKSYLEVNI